MQFLVMSRRRTDQFTDEDFDAVIPQETERVRELYSQGVVRQIWLRDDLPGACFVVEAPSQAEARSVVDQLPMAAAGLSDFEVIPLKPYRGFGPRD